MERKSKTRTRKGKEKTSKIKAKSRRALLFGGKGKINKDTLTEDNFLNKIIETKTTANGHKTTTDTRQDEGGAAPQEQHQVLTVDQDNIGNSKEASRPPLT